jgi:hypothetical protein
MRDRLLNLCLYVVAVPMLLADWISQGLRFGFGRTRILAQAELRRGRLRRGRRSAAMNGRPSEAMTTGY